VKTAYSKYVNPNMRRFEKLEADAMMLLPPHDLREPLVSK
jgi:hypothetical protein